MVVSHKERLFAWRSEGWPAKYPADAVRAEKKRSQQLVGKTGAQSINDGAMLIKAMRDGEMWDDEGTGYGGNLSEKDSALKWTKAQSWGRGSRKSMWDRGPRGSTQVLPLEEVEGEIKTGIEEPDHED